MKTIATAYGDFETGTEIADAVTRYALALARKHSVDVVDIPIVADDGSLGRVQLRVGWLSDMAIVSGAPSEHDLLEIDTILTIMGKTDVLEGGRGVPFAESDMEDFRSADRNWDDVI